jgi:hypothetical protein
MGLLGMLLSATATAIGALMYWTVTFQGSDFRFTTTGVVLMIVGALGFVVSVIIFTDSNSHARSAPFSRSRPVVDARGTNDAVTK